MLDVHPPHHAASSWRDFLIHIVTIVIGLLIAIGLEQGVEMLHERHSLRESHDAMQREYDENAQRITHETQFWRRGAAALQNNLLILRYLQQHPKTTEEQLPGKLFWGLNSMVFAHAAWDSAQQTGIVKLLPQSEATDDAFLYMELQRIETATSEVWLAVNDAEQFNLSDPDPTHLNPTQLSEAIDLTEKALTKQILVGEALLNLTPDFPNLPQAVDQGEINILRSETIWKPESPRNAAEKLTAKRLRAAYEGDLPILTADDAKSLNPAQ
jgi:hypothetical protein